MVVIGQCIYHHKAMNNHIQNNQTGFTLIEALLYMGLSTIMVVLIGGIGVNVFSGFVKAKASEELQYNTQFVTEKIRTIVSQGEDIITPSVGETSDYISIAMTDISKNPTVIDIVDGRVRVSEGEGEAQFISGSSVVASAAEFSNVTYSDGVGSLRAVLHLGLRNPEDRTIYFASSTLYTTVNLQYP